MTATFTPIITTIGQSVFIPAATGIEFTFTHVAVGTGTSAVDASATALQNEIARFAIAGGGINTGGKSASINAIITNHTNANPQAYNISEFGFFGTDGNSNTILFAIYRQGTTIINKVAGVDIAIPFSLALGALPVNNITVQLDTNISAMMALLGQHTALNHPHTQYKRTLDNSEKLKIANATASDEAVSLSQMNSAISGGIGGIPPVDLSGKADKNGNANEKFKVANATASDEAVSKGQLDAKTGIATDIVAGIVEKATQQEMNVGLNNVWPDAATIFNGFERSSTPDGYIKLPEWMGGLIIQWGYNSDTVTVEKLITFPIDFPSVCYNVQCTGDETNNAGAEIINVKNVTRLSFTWIGAVGSGVGVSPEAQKGYWLAIGK